MKPIRIVDKKCMDSQTIYKVQFVDDFPQGEWQVIETDLESIAQFAIDSEHPSIRPYIVTHDDGSSDVNETMYKWAVECDESLRTTVMNFMEDAAECYFVDDHFEACRLASEKNYELDLGRLEALEEERMNKRERAVDFLSGFNRDEFDGRYWPDQMHLRHDI
jgi:hypothetical protein